MNPIIFDLEATCWKDRSSTRQNEIIEIGAVKIDQNGKVLGEFAELSAFCKELTTITQAEVDGAAGYEVVIRDFQKWINLAEPYTLCSWGFYDKKQLSKDSDLHGLSKDWIEDHISLKHQYARINGLKRPMGMGGALAREKMKLEGVHHRGIDDARNIARILLVYFGQWKLR